MLWWIKAKVSCINLSVVVTCEHVDSVSSPTRLKLMGGGREPGEPGKYNPDILKPMALEDPGAGAVSPGIGLLGMHAPE
jgi:hypothetical protein